MVSWAEWIKENCDAEVTHWANGIEFKLCTMHDGWIAVFEVTPAGLEAKIQAADYKHAVSYCNMIEPITVPVQKI